MSPFLTVALEAAQAAEQVINYYYHGQFEVELKEDQSPVTIADVETEQTIKNIILNAFPEHGFYGEETGKTNPDAEYTWLIDPIDGTKSFVRGYPMFSCQIALMHKDEIILGVSNAVAYGELAYAEKGKGAFMHHKPIETSPCTDMMQAAVSTGNIKTIASKPSKWKALAEIMKQAQRTRGYGDFLHYHYLATGKIEAVIESDVNILDIAALSIIVTEAGGTFTDLSGNPLTLDTTTVCAAGSAELHQEVLDTIKYR